MTWLRVWLAGAMCWLAIGALAQAADTLNGTYYGIDHGAGASVFIKPDPDGFTGTFYDRHGNSQDFKADRVDDDAAEAVLDMDGRTVLLRMAPLPYGAQVSLIPFGPDGNLQLEYSLALGFLRQGVRLPTAPADFVTAPREDCRSIAGNSFLASYQFWEPQGVVNGYRCLPGRFKRLMKLFPAVQLDVIWKLCLAPNAGQVLAGALRGQGVTCKQVVDAIAKVQRQDRFNAYKSEVEQERSSLKMSVRCADGYVESRSDCEAAARRLKDAAISLQTPRDVLRRY